jgi:hypothetical protein
MSDSLRVPGRPEPGNPLVMLTAALDRNSEVLVEGFNKVLTLVSAQQRHVYALEPVSNEQGEGFMSYCLACSEEQGAFIHPCRLIRPQALVVPPAMFLVAPASDSTG